MEKQKEEQRREHNAGITLIALIITIIILLILAMVTIRILMNQGIIKHAQNATEAYNNAQNNETEYLTYAEGEMDKYAGTSGGGDGDTYTPPAEDVDALKKYFMGTKEDGSINEEGQSLFDIIDMDKQDPNGFFGYALKDDKNTIGFGSNVLVMGDDIVGQDGQMWTKFYIKYKNQDAYRIDLDHSYNTKDVVFVYHPKGLEGQTKSYQGEQWIVLYDKGSKLELVSPKVIGTVTLGDDDIEKSITSYNNAVGILNEYCKTTLNDNTARCVGSNPNDPVSDNPGMYESENLSNWANGVYNSRGKNSDINEEQDLIRMLFHGTNGGIDTEGNDTTYWLASRLVYENPQIYFNVGSIRTNGHPIYEYLWNVESNGSTNAGDYTHGVRAIVTVNK